MTETRSVLQNRSLSAQMIESIQTYHNRGGQIARSAVINEMIGL